MKNSPLSPISPPTTTTTTTSIRTTLCALLLASTLAGCSVSVAAPAASAPAKPGCIGTFDANADYFPAKAVLSQAIGFSVEYHKSYKVVRVPRPNTADAAQAFVLVKCGAPAPALTGDLATAPTITVPVTRVDASSTTQIASFDLLNALGNVTGIADPAYVTNAKAQALIKANGITGYSDGNGGYDLEKITATRPDLVLQAGMPDPAWTKLRELGINTVPDAGWLETSPLGRAEWIKYYATFLDAEATANTRYAEIETAYNKTKATVTAATKPKVMVGTEYKGVWTVPGADSYVGNYVKDAGGDYVFSSVTGSGTSKLDNETILATGATASLWLNGNWMSMTHWKTVADALAEDPRVGVLPAVKTASVWNPTKLATTSGNEFWESGVVRPDVVLADLAWIFHPEAFPGYVPTYYAKLTP